MAWPETVRRGHAVVVLQLADVVERAVAALLAVLVWQAPVVEGEVEEPRVGVAVAADVGVAVVRRITFTSFGHLRLCQRRGITLIL